MTNLAQPLIREDGQPNNNAVLFTSRSRNFPCGVGYVLVVFWCSFSVVYTTVQLRRLTFDSKVILFDLAVLIYLKAVLLWGYPSRIEIHRDGNSISLILIRLFPNSNLTFQGIESAQHKPYWSWIKKRGCSRRMKNDYATSSRNRIIVKVSSGTEIVITPVDVPGFLHSVAQFADSAVSNYDPEAPLA